MLRCVGWGGILVINANGLIGKLDEIREVIREKVAAVVVISESHLVNEAEEKMIVIDGYSA